MAGTAITGLLVDGGNQAVRLSEGFGLPGDRVLIRRLVDGLLLEPIAADIDAWFAELDRFADVALFADGRDQPAIPAGDKLLE